MKLPYHELEALLAEVADVEIRWDQAMQVWLTKDYHGPGKKSPFLGHEYVWNPVVNHNLMALVKAGLRKKGWGYMITATPTLITVNLIKDERPSSFAMHKTDELRAFAEAVAKTKGVEIT